MKSCEWLASFLHKSTNNINFIFHYFFFFLVNIFSTNHNMLFQQIMLRSCVHKIILIIDLPNTVVPFYEKAFGALKLCNLPS